MDATRSVHVLAAEMALEQLLREAPRVPVPGVQAADSRSQGVVQPENQIPGRVFIE